MPASTDYINQYEHNGTYYDLHDVDLRSKVGTANGIAELDSSGLVPSSQLPSYVDDVMNGYYANSQFYPESSPTYPGYLDNGVFYADANHTVVITPVADSYYYDITGDQYYQYNGSAYVQTTAPTPITPENDKIYVNLAADPAEIYRWSGTAYVKMSSGDGGLVLGETSETAYRGDRGKIAYDHSQDSGRVHTATVSGLYKVAATAEGHIAGLEAVLKADITSLGIPGSDTTYSVVSKTAPGLAPQLPNETTTTKFLRQDGTWQVPPDNNTTYTFAGGTNKITVTPSGGTAQDVTVTPSITNNITGSGTSGYIAKFNGGNTIANGPAIGTDTTKFLRNDGSWVAPPDTNTTYTVATGDSNGQIKVTPSSGSAYNVGVKGLGTAAYANLANTVMEVGKAASRSTATVGTWTAMCNSTSTGSPKPPSTSKWWNIMSLNNWSDSAINWVSQLGVPTQDVNGTPVDTVWFKHNDASGTNIDSSTWHSLVSGNIVAGARFGTTGNTTKIKININSETSWMLSFVVTLYQEYRATKVMISGYNFSSNHWHQPVAKLLADSTNATINVYFGYDANWKLWVGFDGASYTGVSVSDVCNGYTQITEYNNLFTITNVSSLATIQTTTTATKPDAATVNGLTFSLVT